MQMSRLAAASGDTRTEVKTGDTRTFTCKDGETVIPYAVLGKPDFEVRKVNMVVFHDFFDTLEATQIFFKQLVTEHMGCQVLVMNYPGQAGTSWRPEPTDEEKSQGAKYYP